MSNDAIEPDAIEPESGEPAATSASGTPPDGAGNSGHAGDSVWSDGEAMIQPIAATATDVPPRSSWLWMDREGLPSWLNGAIWRLVLAVVGLYIAAWLTGRLRGLLITLFISLFLSFAIEPAVNSLERRGVRRGLGTAAIFLILIGAIVAIGIAMGQVIAEQITDLVDQAPERIASLETWLQENVDDQIDLTELQQSVSESGEFRSRATDLAGGLVDFGGQVVVALFDIFTVALFTFYLVAEGPKFRRTLCSLLPPRQQRRVLEIWDIGMLKTGGYIVSRMVLVVVAFIVHWVAFEVIGVNFSLVLAIWVGLVSQFVPVIGVYVAAVFPVLIALADRPISALWVVVFMVIWQQIENYVIAPKVTASTMEVHPAVAFGSVIAGTAILGPVGALLALPVSATIQGFMSSYAARYNVEVDVNTAGLAIDAADADDDQRHHPPGLSGFPGLGGSGSGGDRARSAESGDGADLDDA
ncbi:MAG: AI-2E family transporter [Actinomycetota bacterium]